MKRFLSIFLTVLLMLTSYSMVFAIPSTDSIITEIKTKAESDKYRFMLVEEGGITPELKENIADNDKMYLSDSPIGSVKIKVIDAKTGDPIKDASCILTFSKKRNSVNSDGSRVQIANPFLLFNLGKTPENGEILFKDTYFYTTSKIEPGTAPFADSLQVGTASIADKDPLISFDYSKKDKVYSSDKETLNNVISKLNNKTEMKFSELKSIIKEIAPSKYAETVKGFFDYDFANFSDSVKIKVYDNPEYKKLIDAGKQEITLGELRQYIKDNNDLFVRYVALREYADLGGFTPDFVLQDEPEYEYTTTYKDGSKKTETSTPYIGLTIFDNVTGGTGYAISSNAFSYRAYVYADNYITGQSFGEIINQDYVDKDVIKNIYLSKDFAPVVVSDKSNAVVGIIKDGSGKAIPSATVKLIGTDFKTTSNDKGYFSFTGLKDEKINLEITNPENGEVFKAKAIYKNKEYALNNIPITLSGENQFYQITVITGEEAKANFPSWVLFLIIIVILIIIILIVFFIMKKKKTTCKNCGAKINKDAANCPNCGNPTK